MIQVIGLTALAFGLIISIVMWPEWKQKKRKKRIIDIMKQDEDAGLYD